MAQSNCHMWLCLNPRVTTGLSYPLVQSILHGICCQNIFCLGYEKVLGHSLHYCKIAVPLNSHQFVHTAAEETTSEAYSSV